MTAPEVLQGLVLVRNYYARDGRPHQLNDAQVGVYVAGLSRYSVGELDAACHAWIRQSKWFPALSDLLELIEGKPLDLQTAAQLAWTTVERAIRQAGAYRGVTFTDAAIGKTVQQVFGSWPSACGFDFDSPGFAIRRQTFVAIFPAIAQSASAGPFTLAGRHRGEAPLLIGHVDGLPRPRALPEAAPPSHGEAKAILDGLRQRGVITQ